MIITYSGKCFDYNNITKESIDKIDITMALTRLNRFTGHTARPYSVAEHTYNCYRLAKELNYSIREQFLVFIHDFAEVYCGDVNTSLKNLLPEYKKIERQIELAICDYFGIKPPTKEEEKMIKVVDYTMLIIEMRDLTRYDYRKKAECLKGYVDDKLVESFKIDMKCQDSYSLFITLNHILHNFLTNHYDEIKG